MKRLIVDLDGTLCLGTGDYSSAIPCISTVQRLKHYKSLGFQIVLFTSRNMRTYGGNIGLINKHTLPIIIAWLDKYNIEFDEIIMGKPWCGEEGFYVDDRSVRPAEFKSLDYREITALFHSNA